MTWNFAIAPVAREDFAAAVDAITSRRHSLHEDDDDEGSNQPHVEVAKAALKALVSQAQSARVSAEARGYRSWRLTGTMREADNWSEVTEVRLYENP